MKKSIKLSLTFILSFIFILSSCKFADYNLSEAFYRLMSVELRAQELKVLSEETVINGIDAEDEYDVLIITDVHFGNENKGKNGPRREDNWFEYLNNIDAKTGKSLIDTTKFVICMGDVAEHGYESETLRFKKDIVDKLDAKGIPVYNIVGNHDLYNSGWNQWADNLYPHTSFYKFSTPNFSWYFTDSASGTFGGYQYEAFNKDMNKDTKKKLVFSHVPLYANNHQYFVMQNTDERNKIINTCAKNKTSLFIDGHSHVDKYTDFGKFEEFNIPSFLQSYGFAVLHVNEKDQSCSLQVKYY